MAIKNIKYVNIRTSIGKMKCLFMVVDSVNGNSLSVTPNFIIEGSTFSSLDMSNLSITYGRIDQDFYIYGDEGQYAVSRSSNDYRLYADPSGGKTGTYNFIAKATTGEFTFPYFYYREDVGTYGYGRYIIYRSNVGTSYGLSQSDNNGVDFNYSVVKWLRNETLSFSAPDLLTPIPASAADILGKAFNPYSGIPESEEGGGDGDEDNESENNPMDPLPTTSFVDTGFCRIYNPDISQVHALSQYMWTDTTFLQTVINHLKQLIENPMDAIISLSLLPCSIPQGTAEEVKVMYVPTGVYMPPASQQFIDVDCGSVTIKKNIGCALDYNPYTRIHLYLPYIGQVTLNTDEVMGKTLNLVYRIDIVTGICAAHILVDQNIMYVFSGHCSITQPLTSADFSGYLNAMITAAKTVAAVAAGAGGAPEVAAGLIGGPAPRTTRTQQQALDIQTARNPKTGRQITSGTDTYKMDKTTTTEGASFGELASRAASNTVSSVMNSKLIVEHANGFGGNSGYLAQRTPFLIVERARLCNPKEYGNYNGYPSMMYMNLGSVSGYTEVQQVQLTGFNATNPELSEISELLKSGVIL